MMYLASPYSHKNKVIQSRRFHAVCLATARLIAMGKNVFSPIAHSHVVARAGKLGLGWERWAEIDFEWIRMCGNVWVLQLDGWVESVGVQAEIRFAQSMAFPIHYIAPSQLNIPDVPKD